MKYAQAVITQTPEGRWKLTVQSDQRVEMMMTGSFDDVLKELKFAAAKEWERRSKF